MTPWQTFAPMLLGRRWEYCLIYDWQRGDKTLLLWNGCDFRSACSKQKSPNALYLNLISSTTIQKSESKKKTYFCLITFLLILLNWLRDKNEWDRALNESKEEQTFSLLCVCVCGVCGGGGVILHPWAAVGTSTSPWNYYHQGFPFQYRT